MDTFDIVLCAILTVAAIASMLLFPDIPGGTRGHHEALTSRFETTGDGGTIDDHPMMGDAAVAYVDRIIDRQLTKARGILSFDGLILAFLGLISRGAPVGMTGQHEAPILLMMALLAISSGICLTQFRARWGYVADFATFSRETAATLELARRRSFWIERTVRLSVLALAGIVTLLVARVVGA